MGVKIETHLNMFFYIVGVNVVFLTSGLAQNVSFVELWLATITVTLFACESAERRGKKN